MTRDAEHTPSPQSVVVPGSAWERFLYRSDFLRGAAVVDGHDVSLRSFASLVEELKAAAAPAPSSLAGGEVDAAVEHLTKRLNKPGAFHLGDELHLRTILAALSPEAPARATEDDLNDLAKEAHDEGYLNGFADAKWDRDQVYDRAVLTEDMDRDCLRDSWYEGLSSDFRSRIAAALTPRHEAPAEGAGERADLITDLEALLAAEPVFVVNHPIQRAINALRARSSAPEAREGEAVAYGADHQPWCQPGDQTQRAFRLRFEDPDMREMVWTGADAEKEALAAYNQYAPAWNVYLFSGHPRAAPSADKLRTAVEALEKIERISYADSDEEAVARQALAALKAEGAK